MPSRAAGFCRRHQLSCPTTSPHLQGARTHGSMAHETIDGKLCPQAYHDVYRLVCPNDENRVTESIFSKMTLESHLERDQLKAIWTACDVDKVGVLKKQHLFQALALLALAQHGEEPALATLQGYPELPVPELGDMKSAASQTKLAGSVTMDFTYTELQVGRGFGAGLAALTSAPELLHWPLWFILSTVGCENAHAGCDTCPEFRVHPGHNRKEKGRPEEAHHLHHLLPGKLGLPRASAAAVILLQGAGWLGG